MIPCILFLSDMIPMITRIWRGWTTRANAAAYEQLLISTIFPGIAAKHIPGFLGIRLDRRELDTEVEFVTTMVFASMDAVIAFAGERHTVSVVPPAARAVLARFDPEATHYDMIAGMGTLTPPALTRPARA